jgi:hypothetical protein
MPCGACLWQQRGRQALSAAHTLTTPRLFSAPIPHRSAPAGPSSADVIARAQRSMSAIVHSPPQNLPEYTCALIDVPPADAPRGALGAHHSPDC